MESHVKKLPILACILAFGLLLGQASDPGAVGAAGEREAVVYYNEACDECAHYINGELSEVLAARQVALVRKDYINQRENRKELNELNARLGVPLELQSHLATYIDGGRIVLQGEPPRAVVDALLTGAASLPERILVYAEEGDSAEKTYRAWAFAGPVQTYPAAAPLQNYLDWFAANRAGFAAAAAAPAAQGSAAALLPAVLFTGLVDGINPCAIAILLFFITFLFTIRKTGASIARMGLVYIGAVYIVYFLIGLGLLRASTIFQGHWLGQAGAVLLIVFGLLNVTGALFPRFPIRLEVPSSSKESLKTWMYRATLPTTVVLGVLVGIHEFPCSGGPYVAILGLLGSQTGFAQGLGYLGLYNLMFVVPLVVVLALALNPVVGHKLQAWERSSSRPLRGITGAIMAAMGVVMLLFVL
jgi:cytochrome c biogenesis protein CcdA